MTSDARSDRLPARVLPLLYFGFARFCFGAAFLFLAIRSDALVGFFYHPQIIAVVHLVTLGWITSSILGAMYLVGPLALRMSMPAGRIDYSAFVFFALGVLGMVGHFCLDTYPGMLWSAGILLLGVALVTGRVLTALASAGLPLAVKSHIGFAFLNMLAAGVFGFLVGLEKVDVYVLPGFVLDSVYAHVHITALGWATMMVVGIGYRLFPMFLPSAMPSGSGVWASALLLEAGALGLFVSLMASSRSTGLWALVAVSGLVAFFWQVAGCSGIRDRPPRTCGDRTSEWGTRLPHSFTSPAPPFWD
jgi:hypothetical protein